jgi:hypothetical protein
MVSTEVVSSALFGPDERATQVNCGEKGLAEGDGEAGAIANEVQVTISLSSGPDRWALVLMQ